MAIRITQAGLGLTVGIIVLALVVLGGLYLVKERGEQARRDEALQIAQQNLQSQSENGAAVPSVDGDTENSGTVTEEESTVTEKEVNTGNQEVAVEETVTEESTTENAPNELPQTGANDISALLAVSMLAFVGASYIASRRALAAAEQS